MATRLFRAVGALAVVTLFVAAFMYPDAWLYLAIRGGALAILVIGGYLGWRRKQQALRRKRECLNCGYSRRGLPADGQCPECGTFFEQ